MVLSLLFHTRKYKKNQEYKELNLKGLFETQLVHKESIYKMTL